MISRSARFLLFGTFLFSLLSASVPLSAEAALVPCGRSGADATAEEQKPCTVCHIVIGGKGIIDWGLKIMTFAAVAVIVAMGIFYIVSTGDEGMMQTAKGGIKAAMIGFAVMLAAWLIVNTTLRILTAKVPGLGITASGFTFSCDTSSSAGTGTGGGDTGRKCVTETLQSIEIQCENGGTDYIALGTDSEEKPKDAKLKAIGKYTCDTGSGGNLSEKDITSMVAWASADETVIKVDGGIVEAVGSGKTSIKAMYEGKASNTMETYVNSCPVSESAGSGYSSGGNEKLYSKSPLIGIETAQAQSNTSCKGCLPYKEEPLCKFVTGNKAADFAFVAVPINTVITATDDQPCAGSRDVWSRAKNPPGFDGVVGEFKKAVDLTRDGVKDNYFSLYRIDRVFESDGMAIDAVTQQCPELRNRKLISLAFVQKGIPKGYNAYADFAGPYAWYCSGGVSSGVFAHEQLGHVIGALDDEYISLGRTTSPKEAHYSCTADSACKKWQNIGGGSLGGCYQGCNYSSVYFKSSENSIMLDSTGGLGFSRLHRHIMKYRLDNFPNGPPYLREFFP